MMQPSGNNLDATNKNKVHSEKHGAAVSRFTALGFYLHVCRNEISEGGTDALPALCLNI